MEFRRSSAGQRLSANKDHESRPDVGASRIRIKRIVTIQLQYAAPYFVLSALSGQRRERGTRDPPRYLLLLAIDLVA